MDRNTNRNMSQNTQNSSNTRPLSLVQAESSRNQQSPQNRNQQQHVLNQPRQPHNLQGLLRFAMEATQNEDAPNQSSFQTLDEDKKKFLNEALSSLTVNVIEELQKDVKKLQDVVDLRIEDDPSEFEAALERICDYTDNMDIANDFYKLGGFSILGICLNSVHCGIRWRCADLIAELTQNNPFCQEKIVEAGFMPILLGMVDSDPSDLARIKSLYAVSCIVRGHATGLKHLEHYDGYSILIRAIQSPVEKLQIKSAFLLSVLCNRDNENSTKPILLKMGLIEQVAGLLAMSNLPMETREQLLGVLNALTSNNYFPALMECRRPELCLKQTLERHLQGSRRDGSLEIEDLCKELIDKLFMEQENEQDR